VTAAILAIGFSLCPVACYRARDSIQTISSKLNHCIRRARKVCDMTEDDPCPFGPADLAGSLGENLLALNNAHARELSWLEPVDLVRLVSAASLALRIGHVAAFLLAFDQDADHDAGNFLWFRARHARFVYVDRVVVAASERGRGHARRLYDAVFRQAAESGHDRIVCEVNLEPPNPASDAFHAALGFGEVGTAVIDGGPKTVRYLSRRLT